MISIIIPALNEETVLDVTLKNLKRLSHYPFEIIISEGRSTDRTVEVANRYADRVVIYEGEKRQTIAQAKNLGAAFATGEYFVFLDADVLIPDPDAFFKKAVEVFEQDPRVVALTAPIRVMAEYEKFSDRFWFGFLNVTNTLNNNYLRVGTAPGEFQMMRAETFRKLGGYRESLVAGEDYEMFGRLARAGKTRMLSGWYIRHTGRRAHQVGWPKVLALWFGNWVSMLLFKKSISKEWHVIR